MLRHRSPPARRILTILLALGVAIGSVAPVSAQPDPPSAVVSPAELYVGHPVPLRLTVTGTTTSFEQGVTGAALLRPTGDDDAFWYEDVEGALGPVTVGSSTELSVELAVPLDVGEYLLRITDPDGDLDLSLEVLWPRIEVEPFVLDDGYGAPRPMLVRGFGTDFLDAPPGVTVFSVGFSEDGQVLTEVEGAVGEVLVHGTDSLSFELLLTLPVGEYVAQVALGDETFDGWFRVEPPDVYAWVYPHRLEDGYDPPVTMTVEGTRTSFVAGLTTVEILREVWEDDEPAYLEVPGAVGRVDVESATRLTFELVDELGLGSYLARISTGEEVVLADFRVTGPPTAWVVPWWFESGHPLPLEMHVYGDGIRFEDGVTTVQLLREVWDEDGQWSVEVPDALERLTVVEPGWLTFDLVVPLEPGTYELRIETDGLVVWPTFVVSGPYEPVPYASIDPGRLPEGYRLPQTLTVLGEDTHFEQGLTSLALSVERWDDDLEDWVWDEAPPALGEVQVLGPTELAVELALSLPAGRYLVTITTGAEVVHAAFVVGGLGEDPWVVLEPARLREGYELPQPLTILGYGTSFAADETSVVVLHEQWDETTGWDEWVPIPGAVEDLQVLGPGELTFGLAAPLRPGWYPVQVRTGGRTLEVWLEVTSSTTYAHAWVDPMSFEVGHDVPLTMTVWGTDTSFTQGVTEVTLLGYVEAEGSWDLTEFPGAIGEVHVQSTTRLTYALLLPLGATSYIARITTGDESVDAWFWVTGPPDPYLSSIDPAWLAAGYRPPVTLTVVGQGTGFAAGITEAVLLRWEWVEEQGSYRPITGALGPVEVIGPTELRFDLLAELPEGWYVVQVVTGDQVLEHGFGIWDLRPRLVAYPSALIEGYTVPLEADVSGAHTSFLDGETRVAILREVEHDDGSTWEPIPGATGSVEVLDHWNLRFLLLLPLEPGTYRLRITTGEEVVEGPLHVAAVLDPIVVSKTAAAASTPVGGRNGYTITVTNPNDEAVPLDAIVDTLPDGFRYVPGSTSGATQHDPISSEPELVWTAPFLVPAAGSLSLSFEVTVSEVSGSFDNLADAVTPHWRFPVQSSGPTATITVEPVGPPPPLTTCVDLVASEAVGEVCVEVGEHVIAITTTVTEPWSLREVAVAVADEVAGFPLTTRGAKAGQPIVKAYPYRSRHPSGTHTVHTEIPVGTVTVDDGFLVSLHATVERPDGRGRKTVTVSAWATGEPFVVGQPAAYFEVPAR